VDHTLSNVLECIGVYCKSSYDLQYQSQIGEGRLTYCGKLFATYIWNEDESAPYFLFDKHQDFYKNHPDKRGEKLAEDFMRQQFFKRPFIHNRMVINHPDQYVLYNIDYVVQELKNDLSFSQALHLRFIRDKWAANLDMLYETKNNNIQHIINASMTQNSYDRLNQKTHPELWKHLALCVVYDI
jgi:hypothetical protein